MGTAVEGVRGASRGAGARTLAFEFTGSGGEYFRIWIVNVFLTVVTLGIYSAWAKVRTKSYFYRSTRLDGSTFEYLADPMKILKGRMIIGGVFGLALLLQVVSPMLYLGLVGVLVLLSPAIMVLSTSFNARNSAYRNVRFGFLGSIGDAYGAFIRGLLVYVFTLGIGFPYLQWRIARFVMPNYTYGKTRFGWLGTPGQFFKVYFIALLFVLPALIPFFFAISSLGDSIRESGGAPPDLMHSSQMVLALVGFYAGVLLAAGYVQAMLANVVFSATSIGPHRLESDQSALAVIWIFVSNAVAVVCSAGLLAPWAKVRFMRYRLEHLRLHAAGDLVAEADRELAERGVLGDAATDLGDLDFDFGL